MYTCADNVALSAAAVAAIDRYLLPAGPTAANRYASTVYKYYKYDDIHKTGSGAESDISMTPFCFKREEYI